jgi:MFS family permease
LPRDATPPPAPPAFSPAEIRTIVVGLMLALFLSSLDQPIVATALPAIAGDLGGWEMIAWVVSAYTWHRIFWLDMPLGAAAFAMTCRQLKRLGRPRPVAGVRLGGDDAAGSRHRRADVADDGRHPERAGPAGRRHRRRLHDVLSPARRCFGVAALSVLLIGRLAAGLPAEAAALGAEAGLALFRPDRRASLPSAALEALTGPLADAFTAVFAACAASSPAARSPPSA